MSAEQKFKCEICGKEFKAINNTHLKKHGITVKEYKEKFPNAKIGNFEHFKEWRNSKENKEFLRNLAKKVHKDPVLTEKRIEGVRKAVKKDSYRKKMSKISKEVSQRPSRIKFYKSAKNRVTEWMKLSNYQRWLIKYGKEEADRRQLLWSKNNVLPTKSKNTKPELLFQNILDNLNIEYLKQKVIRKYRCDFYIPEYHLIVEIDGDYWHANPAKYSAEDLIGAKKQLAKEIWENDKKKSSTIISEGYNLIRYWASELKNISHDKIFEDIVHASTKVED